MGFWYNQDSIIKLRKSLSYGFYEKSFYSGSLFSSFCDANGSSSFVKLDLLIVVYGPVTQRCSPLQVLWNAYCQVVAIARPSTLLSPKAF